MSLVGRIALVTGASRGIGAEIAKRLATDGAQIVCVASKKENSQPIADEIKKKGGMAIAFGCDVADFSAVEVLVKEITDSLGAPTILINNAGLTRDSLMMRMSEDDWDRVIDVNLKGSFALVKHCHRGMIKEKWGRIVNITSVVGLHGSAGQTNYSASKAGLVGLTMSVAKELGSRNITCNAIAPGFIETVMTAVLSQEIRDTVIKSTPLGRLGLPKDIAGVVSFLCSDDAEYITGQTLTVDGGLTL